MRWDAFLCLYHSAVVVMRLVGKHNGSTAELVAIGNCNCCARLDHPMCRHNHAVTSAFLSKTVMGKTTMFAAISVSID